MKPLNIAVAGCGPAGLAAALLLNRDGHHVTLLERFEAPRPIGSGLMIQPTGFAVLDRLGLADTVIRRGARIDRLIGENRPEGTNRPRCPLRGPEGRGQLRYRHPPCEPVRRAA